MDFQDGVLPVGRCDVADEAQDFQDGATEPCGLASVRQCSQMVELLDRQISELESITTQLISRRERWAARLIAMKEGEGKSRRPARAARGALYQAVVAALDDATGGLTLQEIDRAISGELTSYRRPSISAVLARLREEGRVVHEGALWRVARSRP